MITIVDYGVGNLGSIANMLKKVGVAVQVASDATKVASGSGLILPGVGHFDHCARALRASGLVPVVEERVHSAKVPLLGICVGMQLLARGSEEGTEPGLGWIPGDVKRFALGADAGLPIPHMGWAKVEPTPGAKLFDHAAQERFYFVHSFHMVCDDPSSVAAHAEYGYRFVAAVQQDHVFGTQFHPEKSHRFGLALMRRFAEYVEQRSAA